MPDSTLALLSSAQRRALKARAHHLEPVVMIGDAGLTPAVLREIDVHLKSHELIKIRVFGDERAARVSIMDTVCTSLNASPVQHIGKLLVIYRPKPPKSAEFSGAIGPLSKRKRASGKGLRRTKRSYQG
jgi:putative YhbY family RNA-binding protein